jgi:hypothetical protein
MSVSREKEGEQMGESIEAMRDRTRADRVRVWQLAHDEGISPEKAMLQLFPEDTNRAKKLKTWKAKGLYPPSREEIEPDPDTTKHESTHISEPDRGGCVLYEHYPTYGETKTVLIPDSDLTQCVQSVLSREEIEAMVTEIVQRVVDRALETRLANLPASHQGTIPRFRRAGATTRSVRLGPDMIRLAEQEARRRFGGVKGTLNQLVEVLIWEALGHPAELIEPDPDSEPNT